MIAVGKQILLYVSSSCFYTVKEILQGKSYNLWHRVRDGVTQYSSKAAVDIRALWSFWGSGNALVFSVPLWLRMPMRHVLSLGWTAYLSHLRCTALALLKKRPSASWRAASQSPLPPMRSAAPSREAKGAAGARQKLWRALRRRSPILIPCKSLFLLIDSISIFIPSDTIPSK